MSQQVDPQAIYLGRTDIRIPPLGTGTWAWGDRMFWGYGRNYSQADVEGAFQTSLTSGVNFFDTAEIYGWGRSERLLGQFIVAAGKPVVVATKFMPFPWRLRRKNLIDALRGSLKRLGMERVDLYQVHWPIAPVQIETWMDGMAEAVEAGLTRAVGVSNFSVSQMEQAYSALSRRGLALASNQVGYGLLNRAPERTGLLAACRQMGVTLIAYSPLTQGILTGKYTLENRPPGLRGRRYRSSRLAAIQPLIQLLHHIGEVHDSKTPAQVALNWVICKGAVPIPGAKTARQAQENAGAIGWSLKHDEVAALDEASQLTRW
ncbi:MAG: aldo/keto reductase [Dehalococcoidia bacterium]|nr:aldo/keto reductase [Dehalococcoidia bacterium]